MDEEYNFNVKKEQPEEIFNDVRDYFTGETLTNYAQSKSIMRTQEKITERALELLRVDKESLILDAGSGPGFSSILLNELGYRVLALDLIPEFLSFYKLNEINPIVGDMCNLPFRPNVFNGILSISAIQWIYRNPNDPKMIRNTKQLVASLDEILKENGRIVFQYYPKNDKIMKKLGSLISSNSRFIGNFIIDNPESPKKRKVFISLNKRD